MIQRDIIVFVAVIFLLTVEPVQGVNDVQKLTSIQGHYGVQQKLKELEDRISQLETIKEPPLIGFMANFQGVDIVVGSTHELTVPFNKILWNEGSGYDVRRHTFTAPISGLYAFHVNVLSAYGHGCVWLMKNGGKQTSGWASQKHSTVHISAGLKLVKGDKVWVNACLRSTFDNDTGNSFSGYLVKATE